MLPAILAAVGLLKGLGPDKWKEDRQRWMAANTQRLSPWTGLRAQPIQEADPLGSAAKYGMAGLSQEQNVAAAQPGESPAAAAPVSSVALPNSSPVQAAQSGRGAYAADISLEDPASAMANGMPEQGAVGPTTDASKRLKAAQNLYSLVRR